MAKPPPQYLPSGAPLPKKKKKKKPPQYLPSGAPTPKSPKPAAAPVRPDVPRTTEDVAKMVVGGYYGRTGKLPAPETTLALTQAAQNDPTLQTQEDFNDLFRPWLKFIEDPRDLDLSSPIVDKANNDHDKRADRKKPKWTKKELAALPFKDLTADETRALANTTIYGEKMGADEIARIYAAREWYDPTWGAPGGGTALKSRIIERQVTGEISKTVGDAGDKFFKEDGKPNLNILKQWRDETGQPADTLMDPLQWAKLRDALEGEAPEALSKGRLEDLQGLAQRFATVYPGFASHYGGQLANVKWDKYFDKTFTKYIVEANLGYAMGKHLPEIDPDGKLKEQAKKNIEIATGGAVPADADIHEALSYLSSLGDPDNPESPMQELSDFIFQGYYNAHAESWSDRKVVASFVNDFGMNALPDAYLGEYQQDRTAWDVPMKTLMETRRRNIAEGGRGADMSFDGFLESLADSVYSDEYVLPISAPPEELPKPELNSPVGGRPFTVANQGDGPVDRFIDTQVIPFVEDYLAKPAFSALNWVEKQKNRLYLTTALVAAKSNMQAAVRPIGADPVSLHETGRAGVLGGNATVGTYASGFVLPIGLDPEQQFNPRNWIDAWGASTKKTNEGEAGNQAYTRQIWQSAGMDPEEHSLLFMGADLAWSLSTDMLVDAGIGGAFKGGGTLAAKIARKTLSPKLAAKVAAAEKEVAIAAGALSDSARGGKVADQAAAARLNKAKQTLALLKRPKWYDTTAIALSKSQQRPHQVAEFLGVDRVLDSMTDVAARREAAGIIGRIGVSRDADEVLEAMNELSHRFGMKLDPGAVWYGKGARYHRIMHAGDDLAYARESIESGVRISGGLENTAGSIRKFGTLTRMGHANTAAGRAAAAREVDELLDAWFLLDGVNAEELNLNKLKLWDEMWARIQKNMEARPLTPSEIAAIKKWARRTGTVLDDTAGGWRKNAWAAAKAADAVAAPRMKRTPGKAGTRAYGGEVALEAAGVETKGPVKEWQLAKDLTFPVNPQKLIAFQRGSGALGWELRQTTGLLGIPFTDWRRFGLSPDAVTTAFKQLVIGRPFFALTVIGIDEFWRPEFQEAFWKRIIKHKAYKRLKNSPEAQKELGRVMVDSLDEMVRGSDTWIPITPEMGLDDSGTLAGRFGHYVDQFNGHVEAMHHETATRVLELLPRKEGESLDSWAGRLEDAITDLATGKKSEVFTSMSDDEFEEISAHFRVKLQELGLDYRTDGGDFLPPEQIATENAARSANLADAWDEVAEATAEREALDAEAAGLKADISGEEGRELRFNKPSKRFTAEWLRREHPDDVVTDAGKVLDDNEVISAFADDIADKATKKRLYSDWKNAVMERKGMGEQWRRLKEIEEQRKSATQRISASYERQRELETEGLLRCDPGSKMESWIKYTVSDMRNYMADDELLDALLNAKRLKRKQLVAIRARLNEQGAELPTIIGVKGSPDWGPGSIPGVTWLNNMTTMKVMDKISNMMSRTVFLDHLAREHDRLLALGIKSDEAWARAGAVAQREAERILYRHAASPIENAGRNVALFLPAYRQATVYWAKQFAKHPVLLSDIRERGKSDYPMARVGDYQFAVPKPFWMASDFGEMGIPGLGPMIIVPLRAINSATGYTKQEDGSYKYTGNTKLDFMRDIPPLSFVNKSTSPLAWVDDLLWGVFGEDMYKWSIGETQSWAGTVAGGALRSLFRDQKKREQLAINIANAQIASGIKPDYGKALKEMRDKPWWQDVADGLLGAVGFEGGQADGILAAVSRQGFISRVSYKPADLGHKPGTSLWEKIFGQTAVSMGDAQYEYFEAVKSGDQKKMQAVLDKYPKYKRVHDFWDLNARERAEFLAKPENLWVLPYVASKNQYDSDGRMLIGSEYRNAKAQGMVYTKAMNEYWDGLQRDFTDVGWYKTLAKLESDRDRDLKNAHKWAVGVINDIAVSKEDKEGLLNDLKYYEQGWMDTLPPKDEYHRGASISAPGWMELAAKRAGIYEQPFKWSAYAIQRRFDEATDTVKNGGGVLPVSLGFAGDVKLEGKRPEGARRGGIEDKYSNAGFFGGRDWDTGAGAALQAADALFSATGSPLFDKRRSTSWATIKETLGEDRDYRRYKQTSMAADEYWKFVNVAEQMESLGIVIPNRDKLNAVARQVDVEYQKYKVATKGLDSWDPKYQAIRNAYRAKLDKLMAPDYAAPLRGGPAGRLAHTWLTQPGPDLKVNKNFVSHVVAQMQKGATPSVLAASYQSNRGNLTPAQQARVRTATFWAATLSTAVVYRDTMKRGTSADGKWRGISTESTEGKKYVSRLTELCRAYSRIDERFRKQFEGIGGEDVIASWLDALN